MPRQPEERKKLSRSDKVFILEAIKVLKNEFVSQYPDQPFPIETYFQQIRTTFAQVHAMGNPSLQALCTDKILSAIHETGVPGYVEQELFTMDMVDDQHADANTMTPSTRPLSSISPDEIQHAKNRRISFEDSARKSAIERNLMKTGLESRVRAVIASHADLPSAVVLSTEYNETIFSWQDEAAKIAQELHNFPELTAKQNELQQRRNALANAYPELPLSSEFLLYHSTVPITPMDSLPSYSFTAATSGVGRDSYRNLPRPAKSDPAKVADVQDSIYKRSKGLASSLGQLCLRLDEYNKKGGRDVIGGTVSQTIQAGAESASTLDAEISSTVQHLVALIARQRQSKSFARDPDKTVGIAFLSRDYRGNDRLCCHNATEEGTELASEVFNALFSKPRENSTRRSSSSRNHPEINMATIGAEVGVGDIEDSPSEDGA
jgi:hypothetical protein